MKDEDKVLRYMLPDLLGESNGITDKEGNLIIRGGLPPDCVVFFIPVEEWKELKKK